jgi:hypothetical protein
MHSAVDRRPYVVEAPLALRSWNNVCLR